MNLTDYDKFKETWLAESFKRSMSMKVGTQDSLLEQYYAQDQTYWHASPNYFKSFSKSSAPIYLSRRLDFYFREDHEFNLRKYSDSLKWIYAARFKKTLNLFNPKNPGDTKIIAPIVQAYFSTLDPVTRNRLSLLWQEYLDTAYWQFIERDGDTNFRGKMLADVLAKHYDGFLISSRVRIGAVGIFNPDFLEIQRSISTKKFLSIFDEGKPQAAPFLNIADITEIVRRAEQHRTPEEIKLLNFIRG